MLWNAERIVQSVHVLCPQCYAEKDHLSLEGPTFVALPVIVDLPTGWKVHSLSLQGPTGRSRSNRVAQSAHPKGVPCNQCDLRRALERPPPLARSLENGGDGEGNEARNDQQPIGAPSRL